LHKHFSVIAVAEFDAHDGRAAITVQVSMALVAPVVFVGVAAPHAEIRLSDADVQV
jgi:hypothetical protein